MEAAQVPFQELRDEDVHQVEVIDGVAVVGHEDESLRVREALPDLLEAAHVIQVLPVLAVHVRDALGLDEDDVIALDMG